MSNYVKFVRGTPEAYARLVDKDNDTLYFISETLADDGVLYLGSKLISGEGDNLNLSSIGELKDVLVKEGVLDKSLLVYDQKTNSWVSTDFNSLIFVGATEKSDGIAGYVPAPKKTQTNLFLRSDGTWASIDSENNTAVVNNILTVENTNTQVSHLDLINNAIQDLPVINQGDIVIIKDLIIGDKWQYTAFVYNGENWKAMDGNYNAENVYFDEDFIFTEKIGTVKTLTNGSATVPAAGKNVKEFLASLFASETQPTITSPTYNLTATPILENTTEIGSYITGYSWDGSWSSGSYSYGSKENSSTSTGINKPTYEISENKMNQTSSLEDGTFELGDNKIQINSTTTKSYATITGKCTYQDSPYTPVTNLGNNASAGSLKGKTITKTADISVTGYRSSFKYIGEDYTTVIDNDFIRNSTNMNSNTKNFGTVTIPKGTKRIMFAVPDGSATLNSVVDVDGMGLPVTDNFTKTVIAVEGANGFAATDYSVFVCEVAEGLAATRYTISIS